MSFLNTLQNNRFWKKNSVPLFWITALLCLLLAISMIVWTLYSQAQTKNANYQPQDISRVVNAKNESYLVSDIISANLFGDPTPKVVVDDAPETTLDLSLQGILWASDSKMARAIIVVDKKKPDLYSVGEEIKDSGASIKEIRSNEVLLDRNGATESLPMVKISSGTDSPLIAYSDAHDDYLNQTPPYIEPPQPYIEPPDPSPTKTELSNARSSIQNKLKKDTEPFKEPDMSSLDKALQKMGEM